MPRQLRLNSELNNMTWRIRPDEILLEVGRVFGSKMGLQKLNLEVVGLIYSDCITFYSRFPAVWSESSTHRQHHQLLIPAAHAGLHDDRHLQGRPRGHQEDSPQEGGAQLDALVGDQTSTRCESREHGPGYWGMH